MNNNENDFPEVELYMTAQGYGFSGVNEAACAEPAYIPIPVHLRKPDAALDRELRGSQGIGGRK